MYLPAVAVCRRLRSDIATLEQQKSFSDSQVSSLRIELKAAQDTIQSLQSLMHNATESLKAAEVRRFSVCRPFAD